MRFGAIANSARGGPQRPPPMGDRVNTATGKDLDDLVLRAGNPRVRKEEK